MLYSPAAKASRANKWKPLKWVGYCTTGHINVQRVVNTDRAWIKHYGYAVPSNCLLCFNSRPNSPDGSFRGSGAAVLPARWGDSMSLRWCSETAPHRHANKLISCHVHFNPHRSDEFIHTGPLPVGIQALMKQLMSIGCPVECNSAQWFILIIGSTLSLCSAAIALFPHSAHYWISTSSLT